MTSNPILVQLIQFAPVAYAIIKPAVLLFIILTIFLVRPNMGGTLQEQMKGIAYFVLLAVSVVLITVGALPPIIAIVSAQQMQPEWYITFLFTFIAGGLLFVWIDNKIRELPFESYAYVQAMYRNCIRIVGVLSIALSMVSLALASMYEQLQLAGFWAVPVALLAYGTILNWLMSDKPLKLATPKPNKKTLIAVKKSKSKK